MGLGTTAGSISKLFNIDVQYKVPIYQRRYVWNTDNWKTLWKDIEKNSNLIHPESHFTGTIVTERIDTESRTDTYEIIDGQQRLATFQIIFCVMRDLCNTPFMTDTYDVASTLRRYLINDSSVLEGDHKFRLTEYDQRAFESVVRGLQVAPAIADHKICEAYSYFRKMISKHIGNDYSKDSSGLQFAYKKLHNLFKSITNNFNVVRIEIDDDESSQKIFETLNATGRQLSEFDYLRNHLFLRAGIGLTDVDPRAKRLELYSSSWAEFEAPDNEWDDIQLNSFLWDFLGAKLGSTRLLTEKKRQPNIKAFDLYRKYSEDSNSMENQEIECEFNQLKVYGENYRNMKTPHTDIGRQMQFYTDLNIISVPPLILYIISELERDSDHQDQVKQFFKTLESYIVQSKLIGLTDRQIYDSIERYFKPVNGNRPTRLNVGDFRDSLEWPELDKVKKSWGQVAKEQHPRFIRYILYRIECFKRENVQRVDMPQENPSFSDLKTLEHVMPKGWRGSWPLYSDLSNLARPIRLYLADLYSDEYKNENKHWWVRPSKNGLVSDDPEYIDAYELALLRIKAEDSIGNLTPLTEALNSALSNKSFEDKKKILSPTRTNLVLTREITEYNDWEGRDILEREERLFEDFQGIWPIH